MSDTQEELSTKSSTSSEREEEENSSISSSNVDSDFLSSDNEEDEEEGNFLIFKEENPYKLVEADEENGVYQVIGNEIILLARAEGVCCLCSEIKKILYVDNSYGGNIPAQVCSSCIEKILG